MIYFHLFILSLVQGITEFLPISSSAHLILLPLTTGWTDQGLVYDIAAHAGSLLAIILYFRQDLFRMACAWIGSLKGNSSNPDAQLAWAVIVATVPIVIAGFILFETVATSFRQPTIIALATIVFGLLLWYADSHGKRSRPVHEFSVKHAIWIGLAQILALIPGTSRSGITMTAGLMLGFSRQAAARFSFYLSVPTIILAALHTLLQYNQGEIVFNPAAFLFVMFFSAISAGLAIHLFLGFIEKIGMLPFVIYRLLLGVTLLLVFPVVI